MLTNNKKLLHHILPILLLALLGMRTAQAVAPGIVIPPKALLTKQGGAYGRCPNGTRALTAAELQRQRRIADVFATDNARLVHIRSV